MDEELRGLVPFAFDDPEPDQRPQEIDQFGDLSGLVPLAFEQEDPEQRPRLTRDARMRAAEDEIMAARESEPLLSRLKRGIGSIFDQLHKDNPPPEPVQPPTQDFGAVEQAFGQAGAPAAGVVPGQEPTGALAPLGAQPEAAAPVDANFAGAQPAFVPPEAPVVAPTPEPVPVIDPVTGAPTPQPAPPVDQPSIGAADPNLVAAAAQDEAFQAAVQQQFEEQEILGSRRLGRLKRGTQVAVTGLRNAPGVIGAFARTIKPEDSVLEKFIENDMIRLTPGERGIELAGTFVPPVVEVLLTKKLARVAAPRLGGAAGRLAETVGRTGAGTRAGGAATGILEGIPTDLAIAIENHDAGELGIGAGIGAVFGLLFPGGGAIANELIEAGAKNADETAQAVADITAQGVREGMDDLPSQLEIAMARAVRDGDDDIAAILDDAIDRLPTAIEAVERRLAAEGAEEGAETAVEAAARVEAPRTPTEPVARGDLPTAEQVGLERSAPAADIEVVGGLGARSAEEQAAREAARVPTPPVEQAPRRVSPEGQAGAPDEARFIAGPATTSPIPRDPTEVPLRPTEAPPVPTEADLGTLRQTEAAPAAGDRRARLRRRFGEEDIGGRRELQEARAELADANTDEITGLVSANAYKKAAARLDDNPEIEQVAIDLVNLKGTNDLISPEAGDEFIARAGAAIAEVADEFGIEARNVFRAGGDEFVVAGPVGRGREIGEAIQERIGRQQIGDTEFTNGSRFGVGNTRAQAEEGVSAMKAAQDDPRFRDAGATPQGGAVRSPGQVEPRTKEALVEGAESAPARVDEDGVPTTRVPDEEVFTEFAPFRGGSGQVATLDSLSDGRAGFIHPDVLRAVAKPAAGGALGATIGAASSQDIEDAPGRALTGAMLGIMAGAGPGLVRTAGNQSKTVRQWLTPGGKLVGSVRQWGEDAAQDLRRSLAGLSGTINESERVIRQNIGDVAEQTEKLYGGPGRASATLGGANPFDSMPPEVREAVNRFMKGEGEALREIPEALRVPIGNMREAVDDYSRAFLKQGIVEGELAQTFDARLGSHLTRSYRVFDDPDWARNAPKALGAEEWEQTKNAFKSWYRSEFPDTTPGQMDNILEDFLAVGEDLNPIRAIQSGKLGRLNANVLARRKSLPYEVRNLWGEHTDPRIQFARTISNQAGYIANYRFLDEFREQGLGRGFLFDPKADPGRVRPEGMTAEIAGEGSNAMAPLRGMRATPEVAEAFQKQFAGDRPLDNIFLRTILMVGTWSKVVKTVLSQVTQTRNLVGNSGFATANGFLFEPMFLRAAAAPVAGGVAGAAAGVAAAPEGGELAAGAAGGFAGAAIGAGVGAGTVARDMNIGSIMGELGFGTSAGGREAFNKMVRLGVVGTSARAEELNKAFSTLRGETLGAFAQNPVIKPTNGVTRTLRNVAAVPFKAYQVEDDVWKVIAYSVERNRYARALGSEATEEELDQMAADVVRQTWPTISETPEIVKQLGRVGGFVSFPSEVFRTIHGTLSLAEREFADPRLRGIAAKRIAGMVAAGTGLAATAAASRRMYNVTREEEEAIREFQPEWSENSTFVHRQPVEDGKFAVVDMSYMDPYSYVLKPVNAFMRGEDWRESANQVLTEVASPWTSGNPLFSEVVKTIRSGDDFTDAVVRGLTPGVLDQWTRAATGRSASLRPVDRNTEVAALFTGVRGEERDIRESLSFMGLDFNRAMRDASSDVSRAVSRGGVTRRLTTQSPLEQLQGTVAESNEDKLEAFRVIRRQVRAARVLGLTRREITSILRDARVSRDNISVILAGVTPDE